MKPLLIVPIFEDNHLLVLNKEAGVLTQPSGTDQESLENLAKAWLKEKYQKPGNVFLEAVHRLDKPVSGVVLFAKTSKALSRLQASMRAKETRKIYWAWVEGLVFPDTGSLIHTVFHDDFHAKVVPQCYPGAKVARLSYKVILRKENRSLIEVELETGRYHQIRLQWSASGHPVIGDIKYGAKQPYLPGAIALHHRSLQIPHPITKDLMLFEAPSPL